MADRLHQDAMEALRERFDVNAKEVSPDELLEIIGDYDVLVVRSRTKVTREVLRRGTSLRVVARAGVGVDNIDVEAATERGIMVVNAPAGSTQSVAELAVGLMLCLARRIPEADRSMKEDRWEKSRLKGVELAGKVLGLIGSGRIGGRVATICQALGMTVIAFDPYLQEEVARERGIELTRLDDVLQRSDFISIHAALTEETSHMISHPQLSMMKRTAYLINCARGKIVDEEALVEALQDGRIAGAGLDVYEKEPPSGSPLLELGNVILTPHIGASTAEAQRRTGLLAVEQVTKAVMGDEPEFLVNKEVLSG
ncbi:MAG: hydroxyacid dehydrogenase [Thermoplasmata archaeon]